MATTAQIPIDRHILALTDEQLESFVREWIGHKIEYAEVQRFTGPGDMGRDVVGYLTKERHDGPWHNYQCKQYGRTLPTGMGLLELGKVLFYSHAGEFTAPTAFYFVAPRGVNRNLRRYISKPAELKAALLGGWDQYCAERIVDGQRLELTADDGYPRVLVLIKVTAPGSHFLSQVSKRPVRPSVHHDPVSQTMVSPCFAPPLSMPQAASAAGSSAR